MGYIITGEDLASSLPGMTGPELEKAAEDAEALAETYAPCLFDPAFDPAAPVNARKVARFRAIVRRAVAYDAEAGSGAVTTTSVSAPGGFSKNQSVDTKQKQAGMLFSPAQIDALKALCGGRGRRAFGVSMIPGG